MVDGSREADHGLVDVMLLGVPVAVLLRSRSYHEGLARELTLVETGRAEAVPDRLVRLGSELGPRLGRFSLPAQARLDQAVAEGVLVVDVTLRVPRSDGVAARELLSLLEEADQLAREGVLLTLVPPEDVAALRRWYLSQFSAQAAGEPPQPYADWLAEHPEG